MDDPFGRNPSVKQERQDRQDYQVPEYLTRQDVRQLLEQMDGFTTWMRGFVEQPKTGYQTQTEQAPFYPVGGDPFASGSDASSSGSQTTQASRPPAFSPRTSAPPPYSPRVSAAPPAAASAPPTVTPPPSTIALSDLPPLPNEEEVMSYLEPELLFIRQVVASSGRAAKSLVEHYESCRNTTALRKLVAAPETTNEDASYVELRRNFLGFLERVGSTPFFRKNDHALGVREGCVLLADSELMDLSVNAIRTLVTFLRQPAMQEYPVRAFLLDAGTRAAFAKVVAAAIAHNKTLVPTTPQFRVSYQRAVSESWTVQAEFSGCTFRDGAVYLLHDHDVPFDQYSVPAFGFAAFDALRDSNVSYIL